MLYHELTTPKPTTPIGRSATIWARAALCAALALLATPLYALEVVLGPADSLALDQPRITFGLTDESTTPVTLIGPNVFNSALLDTGANGILLAAPSYNQGEDYGQPAFAFDYDSSGVIDADELLAQYAELGVAGTSLLDIHDAHALRITDSDNNERIVANNLRAFGDSSLNIGSFAAIVGMPAMQGLAVEVDLRPMAALDFQRVLFHDAAADAAFESAATLNVDLRMLAPEYTDTTLIDNGRPDLLPTFAALPVIDHIDMFHTLEPEDGGATLAASDYTFLLDTGAQTMIISQQMATDMGIDFVNGIAAGGDVVDALEVGGIGGTAIMPLVTVTRFVMPTQSGVDLVFTDLLVGVLDIDGAPFDAVLGMNLLTTGYLAAAFGGGTTEGLVNPLVPNVDAFQILLDNDFVVTVDDLFANLDIIGPVLNISREDYDLLVESQILPDTDDPLVAYTAVLQLDDELNAGNTALGPVFDKVVFDFTATDGTGVMRLDFAQALTIVPEPGTIVLFASGCLMLAWRRYR